MNGTRAAAMLDDVSVSLIAGPRSDYSLPLAAAVEATSSPISRADELPGSLGATIAAVADHVLAGETVGCFGSIRLSAIAPEGRSIDRGRTIYSWMSGRWIATGSRCPSDTPHWDESTAILIISAALGPALSAVVDEEVVAAYSHLLTEAGELAGALCFAFSDAGLVTRLLRGLPWGLSADRAQEAILLALTVSARTSLTTGGQQ